MIFSTLLFSSEILINFFNKDFKITTGQEVQIVDPIKPKVVSEKVFLKRLNMERERWLDEFTHHMDENQRKIRNLEKIRENFENRYVSKILKNEKKNQKKHKMRVLTKF